MGVTIQNITGSTAMVIWPTMAICADSFYSIMYHPNRNNMLSGYSRKIFQKEERVPASRSSFVIENLTPLTTYILCVTCQSANPSSDQCRIFHTLEEDPASATVFCFSSLPGSSFMSRACFHPGSSPRIVSAPAVSPTAPTGVRLFSGFRGPGRSNSSLGQQLILARAASGRPLAETRPS
uniref:Fibronectin type-III domain-containing protein n=1 Tax=Chrysemys picta bellii TaxID=8478 RepID=A0A8C3FPN7_CHRPI